MPPAPGPDVHRFSIPGASHLPGTAHCRICTRSIFGEYYRVNQQTACAKCAGESRVGQPLDSHAAFNRGLLLGAGAALLGLILYASIQIATTFYVGYIALGVAWLVAKAILRGSSGIGGLRYQVAAVLLTYVAISAAAVPIKVAGVIKHNARHIAEQGTGSPVRAESVYGNSPPTQVEQERPAKITLRGIAIRLLMLGLASPFIEWHDPLHGLLGMVILIASLRIAFQLTAPSPLEVDGPFHDPAW